jgi:hypothetical protein
VPVPLVPIEPDVAPGVPLPEPVEDIEPPPRAEEPDFVLLVPIDPDVAPGVPLAEPVEDDGIAVELVDDEGVADGVTDEDVALPV